MHTEAQHPLDEKARATAGERQEVDAACAAALEEEHEVQGLSSCRSETSEGAHSKNGGSYFVDMYEDIADDPMFWPISAPAKDRVGHMQGGYVGNGSCSSALVGAPSPANGER